MAIRIEERIQVEAPADQVWSFFLDPRRVAACAPGTELTEVVDERTFRGNVRVKVGPVTASYAAQGRLVEVDEPARTLRLVGEGKESGAPGTARMSVTVRLGSPSEGRTEVELAADVDVIGRLAQFGRGMVQDVARQIVRQFAACVRARLERPGEGSAADGAPRPISALPLAAKAIGSSLGRLVTGRQGEGDDAAKRAEPADEKGGPAPGEEKPRT